MLEIAVQYVKSEKGREAVEPIAKQQFHVLAYNDSIQDHQLMVSFQMALVLWKSLIP